MATSISDIEYEFAQLPPETQLNVLERLIHLTRLNLSGKTHAWESQLAEMAADPEIKRELNLIDAEFVAAEADGLGKS